MEKVLEMDQNIIMNQKVITDKIKLLNLFFHNKGFWMVKVWYKYIPYNSGKISGESDLYRWLLKSLKKYL